MAKGQSGKAVDVKKAAAGDKPETQWKWKIREAQSCESRLSPRRTRSS